MIMMALLAAVSAVSGAKDYTRGTAVWFDTPTDSKAGAPWTIHDMSASYSNPDTLWERRSFPIGNGSIGASVLGGVSRERLVINEKTLWRGGPGGDAGYWNMNRKVPADTMKRVRELLAEGRNTEAGRVTARNFSGPNKYDADRFGAFTVLGEVYVDVEQSDAATDYRRVLNLDSAVVAVDYVNEAGARRQREYFASYPDSVMVWRFSSDGAPQNLELTFNCPQMVDRIAKRKRGLMWSGHVDGNGMKWAMRIDARVPRGGKVKIDAKSGSIRVENAPVVEFVMSADTDYAINFDPDMTSADAYKGAAPERMVDRTVDRAMKMDYNTLYGRHRDDYRNLYGRVELKINPDQKHENRPLPERLARYRAGEKDWSLEETYFQFGRYLLIASSRKGNLPANLQGMWHNNTDGPWRVDYHNNINLQMNYWPAMSTNLAECFEPFTDYVRTLVKPGEATARDFFGARGWTASISGNPFGMTAPLESGEMAWNYNPMGGPWLATELWDYYDYTGDTLWLAEVAYPMLKGSADFVSDMLYDYNGSLTSAPSYSPEHGECDMGATYANAVSREMLAIGIKAAEVLGRDSESVAEWREKLARIHPYKIGGYGQLCEWYEDIDPYGDPHRHTNHLFGLHPGSSINALTDKALVDACRETLRQRGDAATGWSMGWKLNHWARLLDGNHAYVLFGNLLKEGTADNLWDMHPPFQIDGNFGGTAGIAEMLVQGHNGVIHILPALPDAWASGSVKGLKVRGGYEVDIDWADGKATRVAVRAAHDGVCRVMIDGRVTEKRMRAGEETVM